VPRPSGPVFVQNPNPDCADLVLCRPRAGRLSRCCRQAAIVPVEGPRL